MADANTTIRYTATLDASGVKRGLDDVSSSVSASMERAAASTEKLNANMAKVSETSKMTARQLSLISVQLAGMAVQNLAKVAEARGESKAAGYIQATATGATTGAALGSRFGPWGTAIGAILGGGLGAWQQSESNDAEAKRKEQAEKDLATAYRDSVAAAQSLKEETKQMDSVFAELGDTEKSVSSRKYTRDSWLDTATLMRDQAQEEVDKILQDDRVTEEEAPELEKWSGAVKRFQAYIDRLQDTGIKEGKKTGGGVGRTDSVADAITKIGGSIGGGVASAQDAFQQKTLTYQDRVIKTINQIANAQTVREGAFTWG